VQILGHLGVDYKDINVLEDMGIREGIKSFSQWPTIPQLYVKGEFVGGCDIIREMFPGRVSSASSSTNKGVAYDKAKMTGLTLESAPVSKVHVAAEHIAAHSSAKMGRRWLLENSGRGP